MNLNRSVLCFDRPPDTWIEGLPLGNGRLGAMVMGYPAHERICLNHEAIWRSITNRTLKTVAKHVPEIRRALLEGDWDRSGRVLMEKLQPSDRNSHVAQAEYQPAGDLVFDVSNPLPVEDYERMLDLDRGLAIVRYRMGSTRYTRTCYVSAAHQVIVMHITADKPGAVSGRLWLERQHSADTDFRYRAAGRTVTGHGKIQHGSTFKIEATAIGRGGSIRASREAPLLEVTVCDQVTILVKIHVSGEPAVRTVKIPRQESDLRQAHVAEHQRMFQRVALHLQPMSTTCETKTTDRMVHDAFLGRPATELFERMFDMGRYLLMSSSRTGNLPPHLQGIWNNQLHPPWQSDWHLDMNVQMNYWLAETCHLGSSTRPLFRWVASLIPDGRENARKIWGCRGIVLPMACAGGGKMLPGPWVAWTGAAAWLAQHFWQHYQYTLDRRFLAREAYPFMKEAAAFYEDFLVKDDDGRYMVIPSLSPENSPAERGPWDQTKMMTINATMDIALVRELMENLLAASTLLRKDTAHQTVWRDILARLPDWPVDQDGMLKEWERPENLDNQDYRHYSHLYPLFPGEAFSREQTPKLFAAAAKAVHAREACGYASNAGWSYPYLALLHARLGEGDQALQCLTQLAKSSMMGNLLTIHNDWRFQGLTLYWPLGDRAFMIDAIFGAAAAVAEMLLQSQGGVIRILPALPKVWDKGQVRGLRARGAFEIDITWSARRAQQVRIRSEQGQICRMSGIGSRDGLHVRCAGRTIPVQRHSHGIFSFPTTAGKTYVVQPS